MSWIHPTTEELKLVLSQEEIDKLAGVSNELSDRIQGQLDAIADQFRAAFKAKGYSVDIRDHYIDNGYLIPMLNYARWQIWTTFPMTEDYALSDPRKFMYEEAKELLKNPYMATTKPDYADDPELSSKAMSADVDSAISMPWLKFPTMPFDTGFYKPYALYFDKMEEGI